MQKEASIQKQICEYLRMQYPKIMFNSDMSGIRLTMGQSIQAKKLRSGQGYPDITIYEPRGKYAICFIELKREGETIWKKNGEVVANEHVQEQINVLTKLNQRGYFAVVCIGFEEAKTTIDNYLKMKLL